MKTYMARLLTIGLCALVALVLAATAAAATEPAWYVCGKAVKNGKTFTGHYTGKSCEAATEVESGGKYELRAGVGKAKQFKGKGGSTVLHVRTWLGDEKIECTSSKDSGTPAPPNLETEITITYKGCKAPSGAKCSTFGERAGEVELEGLKGELGMIEESPTEVVGLKLESEANPGPGGELVSFACEGLEVTLAGGLIGVQSKDVNVISKESEKTFLAGEYIGERTHESTKYKPLVNLVGWADEQAAIAKEIHEDEHGEIAKMARPILTATLCGDEIEALVHAHCAPGAYAGEDQTIADRGEALMVKTIGKASEPVRTMLIGERVEHENGGDSKEEEITPLKFVAKKTGTVEEVCYEVGGYLLKEPKVANELILGIQEQIGDKPGKVLGEGTIHGQLPVEAVACVTGLHVPIVKGKTYYLTFLPLGGTITYWYSKAETVIYSEHHKKLTEGPPQNYVYREEEEEAPIGMWGNGTT
ncbi:MAG TPA: hypothetical protein VMB05_08405 [Solirubrobacteraceae bacterium]|nr:hypothetical protein [Solirubrobacteraceae bacterium]